MSRCCLLSLLAAAYAGLGIAHIPPEHAKDVTVYHVNTLSAGAVPINMNTGDALGDLSFYLGQFLLPLECMNTSFDVRSHFDCTNAERVDPSLVVSKVDMTIDSRFTSYSACNLCDGVDPISQKPCKPGSYSCACLAKIDPTLGTTCDPTMVGMEGAQINPLGPTLRTCKTAMLSYCGSAANSSATCFSCVGQHKAELTKAGCKGVDLRKLCPGPRHMEPCSEKAPDWVCWSENLYLKTGGSWYSTLEQGFCDKSNPTPNCSWKHWSTKTVKDSCMKEKLMTRVEAESPGCFKDCGSRNSSCWVYCFYDTLLGPAARHSIQWEGFGGLPNTEIEKAWADAFLPEEEGGCPLVKEISEFRVSAEDSSVVV